MAPTTVLTGQWTGEVMHKAADIPNEIVSTYQFQDLTPKDKQQDFKPQWFEGLTSHMGESARGHIKKELLQPDSQATSWPHIGLTARFECNWQLVIFQAAAPQARMMDVAEEPHGEGAQDDSSLPRERCWLQTRVGWFWA
ncbi:unnamed protein product [Schistocephalus solidus]|uniref:FABP domain-containing protein n=1 Tax=Schistocephalus solidus TaxID=70667 RepID=A0A183SDJ2_SCHSO|nr:unnamed protein product [Schistocephalus solidus]